MSIATLPLKSRRSLSGLALVEQRVENHRLDALQTGCDVLADGFEELSGIVAEYVREIPLAAYEDDVFDAERFLDWLDARLDLTDEQRDYVTCQRCRHAVEFVAIRKRLAHVRFQELLLADEERAGIGPRTKAMVYLNPVHVWATFDTHTFVDEAVEIPAMALFFPVGVETRTLVIDEEAADLVRRLEHSGAMPIRELTSWLSRAAQGRMVEMIRGLAEAGLLAIA